MNFDPADHARDLATGHPAEETVLVWTVGGYRYMARSDAAAVGRDPKVVARSLERLVHAEAQLVAALHKSVLAIRAERR